MLVSTGMSREEKSASPLPVRNAGASYALLQCQSAYPAPFSDVNLAYMDRLAEMVSAWSDTPVTSAWLTTCRSLPVARWREESLRSTSPLTSTEGNAHHRIPAA